MENQQQSKTFSDFNPSKDQRVDEIKRKTDELIELVEGYSASFGGSGVRRAKLAITNYEQAAMWAVKACFSKD